MIAPNGVAGGGKGRTGDIIVNPGRDDEKRLPTRYADYPLKAGDVFRLDTPGGGGSADPRTRDPAAVVADVNEGYVTAEAAERDYGVALVRDGRRYTIDAAGTEELRASAAKRQQFTGQLKAAV